MNNPRRINKLVCLIKSYMAYLHHQYEQLFMYYTVWSRQDPAQNGRGLLRHLRTSGA